jgi:hypothetical protein
MIGVCSGMVSLCISLSMTALSLMAEGQLLRGGIDTGAAIDSGEAEVLGSGLVHAYHLESQIADYPRICIGPRITGLLSHLKDPACKAQLGLDEPQFEILQGIVALVDEMIITDPDGIPRLDYTSPFVCQSLFSRGAGGLIEKARESAQQMLGNVDVVQNPSHFKKLPGLSAPFDLTDRSYGADGERVSMPFPRSRSALMASS